MTEPDYRRALEFHEATKHSYISVRTVFHRLDWANKPSPFKQYEDLPSQPLPHDIPQPESAKLTELDKARGGRLTLHSLASVLYFTAGITRAFKYPDGVHYFRAAPATGALYPIEVYVVAGDVDGLADGVYHFSPNKFALTSLRTGDFRGYLARYACVEAASSQAVLVFTSIGWRNAWKYRERSYRHWFWDSGVMAANLLAVCGSFGIELVVAAGFVDKAVNKLVGVDGVKEAAVIVFPLGSSSKPAQTLDDVQPISPKVRPLSAREHVYKLVEEMHRSSSIESVEELELWKTRAAKHEEKPAEQVNMVPLSGFEEQRPSLWETILRRGSTRRFSLQPINITQLSTILKTASARFATDFNGPYVSIYLIANYVEGLKPGAYFFDGAGLALLKQGEFRRVSAYLCLEQELAGDASAVLFFMAPLHEVLEKMGNRGYRVVQLEGGIRAGLAYLASYSVGLGATGLTFYDDDVREFFSPHADGKENVIVVAVGHPAYRAKPGRMMLGVE
ncbi:MAG: SagB/ThcOx family dehydrogenase [Candidatus Caldarchaeum sp.]|nr:SagB/ThcOx family dehydrogenase [Candidatus Caldarchaeum sp.]